jgi:hypothetical protein
MHQTQKKLSISCPICKTKKVIEVPQSIFESAKQLTTISIPKGKICEHHFQIFIDKNYKVRGFQKVDYELNDQQDSTINQIELDEEEIHVVLNEKTQRRKSMSLKEIYEEFWEYININNDDFKQFIENDFRRKKELNMRDIIEPKKVDLTPHVCKNLE